MIIALRICKPRYLILNQSTPSYSEQLNNLLVVAQLENDRIKIQVSVQSCWINQFALAAGVLKCYLFGNI